MSKTPSGPGTEPTRSEASDPHSDMPRIEFPCPYPIKIMGTASADFESRVFAICQRHAPEVGAEHVSVRPSKQGNYLAITVVIRATGLAQLESLFTDLKAIDNVKMVL